MLEKMKDAMKQLQTMQRLMNDENVTSLIRHPKVQAVFSDPEFQTLIKAQNFTKLATHPKFASLLSDPEFVSLISQLNPQRFLQT